MENKLTPEVLEKAKLAKSAEELIALAKENGAEMTAEEANACFAQLNPKTGELSDDELDNVAGGGCHTKDGRLVVSALHICDDFNGKRGIRRGDEYAECSNCTYCTYEKGLWLCNNPANMK